MRRRAQGRRGQASRRASVVRCRDDGLCERGAARRLNGASVRARPSDRCDCRDPPGKRSVTVAGKTPQAGKVPVRYRPLAQDAGMVPVPYLSRARNLLFSFSFSGATRRDRRYVARCGGSHNGVTSYVSQLTLLCPFREGINAATLNCTEMKYFHLKVEEQNRHVAGGRSGTGCSNEGLSLRNR